MKTALEVPRSLFGPNDYCKGFAVPATLRACDDLRTEATAALVRVDRGLYRFQCAIPFAEDTRLEITMEDCAFKGELISCQELSSGLFLLTAQRIYAPRRAIRTEPRIQVDITGDLRSPSCNRSFVRITDMSQSGLGLEVSCEIKKETRVSVHFAAGVAFGEIRHCSPSSGGNYRAGIQIHEFIARTRDVASAESERRAAYSGITPEQKFDSRMWVLFKRLRCSLSQHSYQWVADSWDRAVLKCSRCGRELDRSFTL